MVVLGKVNNGVDAGVEVDGEHGEGVEGGGVVCRVAEAHHQVVDLECRTGNKFVRTKRALT